MLYYRFSEYLKNKYGTKVYKLPLNLPATCPNRDGRISSSGCIFCGEEGAGFECLPHVLGVKEQLKRNSTYIGKNYNAGKFIAYFQNYSNTYLPFGIFREYILEACTDNIVAIYIATRPDCVNERCLEFLKGVKAQRNVDIVLELGLQTVNYRTLSLLNRGHTLAEFVDAAVRIKYHGLGSCAHCIVDLPMDTIADVSESAKILSALGVGQVKCHSMYILKGTVLGDMYEKKLVLPIPFEDYLERIIVFIEHLNPNIVVQRLIGRAPAERSLFCNWGMSWWKIVEIIEGKMKAEGRYQGKKFNYLNGKALKD